MFRLFPLTSMGPAGGVGGLYPQQAKSTGATFLTTFNPNPNQVRDDKQLDTHPTF
jgi:hypothetical protein